MKGVGADGRRNNQLFWYEIECCCSKVSYFRGGRMLFRILGGFLVAAVWAKMFVGWRGL